MKVHIVVERDYEGDYIYAITDNLGLATEYAKRHSLTVVETRPVHTERWDEWDEWTATWGHYGFRVPGDDRFDQQLTIKKDSNDSWSEWKDPGEMTVLADNSRMFRARGRDRAQVEAAALSVAKQRLPDGYTIAYGHEPGCSTAGPDDYPCPSQCVGTFRYVKIRHSTTEGTD